MESGSGRLTHRSFPQTRTGVSACSVSDSFSYLVSPLKRTTGCRVWPGKQTPGGGIWSESESRELVVSRSGAAGGGPAKGAFPVMFVASEQSSESSQIRVQCGRCEKEQRRAPRKGSSRPTRTCMLRSASARLSAPRLIQRRLFAPVPASLFAFKPSSSSPRSPFSSTAPPTMSSAPHPVHSTSHAADPAAAIPESAAPTATSPAAPAGGANAQKQPKEKKPKKGGDLAQGMASLELNPAPEYLASRVELFERLKKEADEKLASQSSISSLASAEEALSHFLGDWVRGTVELNVSVCQVCPANRSRSRCRTVRPATAPATKPRPCRSHSQSARASPTRPSSQR